MSLIQRIRHAVVEGPPGWFWASVLTTCVVVQEFRDELSTEFAMYAGGLVATWLGYRWGKNRIEVNERRRSIPRGRSYSKIRPSSTRRRRAMTKTPAQMSYEIAQLDEQDVTRTVMVMAPNDLDHDERQAMADLLEDVVTRLRTDDTTPWAHHPG